MKTARMTRSRASNPYLRRLAWADAGFFVTVTIGLNGLIFGLGWQDRGQNGVSGPPGWLVGAILVVLFALFGAAHGLMRGLRETAWVWQMRCFTLLCFAYPIYTGGLQSRGIGLIGCLLSLIWAIALTLLAWRKSRVTSLLMLPSVVWLCFATKLLLS